MISVFLTAYSSQGQMRVKPHSAHWVSRGFTRQAANPSTLLRLAQNTQPGLKLATWKAAELTSAAPG